MNNKIRLVYKAFVPARCCSCGKIINEEEYLCDYCYEMLERTNTVKRCIRCGNRVKDCVCKYRVLHFDGVVSPFVNSGVASKVTYAFKFRGKMRGGEFLAENMALCVRENYSDIKLDCICYVPMAEVKLKHRGYNQCKILADRLGELLGLPVYDGLLMCKNSDTNQHDIKNYGERFHNVAGRYSADDSAEFKRILLVDDITTSGATLNECAKQLLKHGACCVYCVTALFTERKNKTIGEKNDNRHRNRFRLFKNGNILKFKGGSGASERGNGGQ